MRYLNKIVFINSAHIPYAEIKLDGNVHFIGTQGVGKSTILRAILFFYNVDKSRLGIRTQDKQKSYDEFYFPYPNSYIIYEVVRENGRFFVMTFISSGRVAFRIVDCPYDKRFFIEDGGRVWHEWGRISEQIGPKVFKSNIIRSYEEFRDILYGNLQDIKSKDLRRFNLMESPKYQNIPLTIQNIFLNQSLESRVIKDTIIDSMDFSSDSINLTFYRESVKDFRQQYEDVWKWYRKDKNGRVKVKLDADRAIDCYRLSEQSKRNSRELASRMMYALERDRAKIPLIEKNLEEDRAELSRQERLLSEESDKYRKDRDGLKSKEGAVNEFLRQCEAKKRHYVEIGIDSIRERIGREEEHKIRKRSLERQISALTDSASEVSKKYEAAMLDLDNSHRDFLNQIGQKKVEIGSQFNTTLEGISARYTARQEERLTAYNVKMSEIQKDIDTVNQEKTDLRLNLQAVNQQNPHQELMADLTTQIDRLRDRYQQLTKDYSLLKEEQSRITNDVESGLKDLENACEKDLKDIEYELDEVKKNKAGLQGLLDRQKGSLLEWLDSNIDGWKDNIGKVVATDVLYSTSLNPQKTDTGETSLYGIDLDLRNSDLVVCTPEELKARIEELELKEKEISQKADYRRQALEEEVNNLKRKPSEKLKEIRLEMLNLDAEIGQSPIKTESLEKELALLKEDLENWRKAERVKLERSLGEVEERLQICREAKNREEANFHKDVTTLGKETEKQKKDARKEAGQALAVADAQAAAHKEEVDKRKSELQAQMDAELKGLGVDTARLNGLREDLHREEDELRYIKDHMADFIGWQKDKKELFDQEVSRKEELKSMKQKLADLEQRFDSRRGKLEAKINGLKDGLRSEEASIKSLEEAVENAAAFMATSSCPQFVLDAPPMESAEPLPDILEHLKNGILDIQHRMDEFRKAITVFKNNFSPQNIFHFQTEFNSEEDYIEFASQLNEFIVNNKIEEYRVRISRQYTDIIQRIAREVGDLNQHNADIRRTINEINQDFRDNNFAGVIKEIELRTADSNDRLMQHLLNIKKFDDEYGFNMGEGLNLFSTEESFAKTNERAVSLLISLIERLDAEPKRDKITLSDTFKLEFKVRENDNDTNWVEKLTNVGSDGTDVLVKSMVNIMLINVFKRKVSKRFGDFKLHCMMDEIGKLHPDNVEGILKFANIRNIFLINSSPTTYNAQVYKYTYSLSKDDRSNTVVKTLLTIR